MSANKSQDAATDPTSETEERKDLPGSGSGAASALERMKAQHALRHKHHGARTSGPGHEDDRTPER